MVAALLLLAACGSSSPSSDDPPATVETSAPATVETSAPATVCTCPPATAPLVTLPPLPDPAAESFPVAVAANRRSLVDAHSRPWLLVGDAGWSSLVMLDAAAQDEYFDGLAAHFFNAVLVNVIENTYSDHPPLDAAGRAPFVGEMYRSEPTDEYWTGFDRYVAAAAQRGGITVLAVPAYLGYNIDGEAENVGAASLDEMTSFGSFLGARYGDAPNIMWVVGGDRTDVSSELLERLDALARGIRSESNQLITAHTADGATAADVFGGFDWLQINTAYDVTGAPDSAALAASAQVPERPAFSIEGIYEQERGHPLPPGNMLLRYQAYGAVLSGAFGHVFGNNPRWHFGSKTSLFPYDGTWQQSLDDGGGPLDLGTRHMAVFAHVMDAMPWWTLRPDGGTLVTDGRGTGEHQLAAAMDPATGWAAVYTVSTDQITLDLSVLAAAGAELDVRRVDPANGAVTDLGATATSATTRLDYPGANSNGEDDWLYVLSPTAAN